MVERTTISQPYTLHESGVGPSVARRLDGAEGRVWVVTSFPGPWARLANPLMRRLEEKGLTRADARDFLGVQVLLYTRR